jgi:hypothetical protein
VGLKLDTFTAGRQRVIDHLNSLVEVTFVINANFGNNEGFMCKAYEAAAQANFR